MSRPDFVAEQPVSPDLARSLASGQIRIHPMEVLCGACGGIGCDLCAEPEPPERSRWARAWAVLRGSEP